MCTICIVFFPLCNMFFIGSLNDCECFSQVAVCMNIFIGTSMLAVIVFTKLPTPLKIKVVHPIAKVLGEFKIVRFNGGSVLWPR